MQKEYPTTSNRQNSQRTQENEIFALVILGILTFFAGRMASKKKQSMQDEYHTTANQNHTRKPRKKQVFALIILGILIFIAGLMTARPYYYKAGVVASMMKFNCPAVAGKTCRATPYFGIPLMKYVHKYHHHRRWLLHWGIEPTTWDTSFTVDSIKSTKNGEIVAMHFTSKTTETATGIHATTESGKITMLIKHNENHGFYYVGGVLHGKVVEAKSGKTKTPVKHNKNDGFHYVGTIMPDQSVEAKP